MEPADVLVAPPLLSSLPETVARPKVSACPWGKVTSVEAVSLNDVMSEQLISSLVEEKPITSPDSAVFVDDLTGCGDELTDCRDDHFLAKLLQLQFDKEHDAILRHEESKFNGQSKVKISYGKYCRLPVDVAASSDDEDDKDYFLEQNQKNHWSNFEKAEKSFQAVGKSGVSRQGNVTTTKHNPTVCERRNAGKLMELNCISTGDGGMFDMKISNNVYNVLRRYSKAESKRGQRLHEKKEKSTTEKALDEKTHLVLYKMVNSQILESLTGCISTGKEACVYHAWGGLPEDGSPAPEFAIKVYKTTLNEFQNRDQYVKGDYRFKNRFTKQNPRKIIHLWAEKEMRNLIRMKEANIPCPEVVILKKHVLVMSFIGKDNLPAPKLKDLNAPFEDMTVIFEQSVDIMKTLYSECKLVHADFSEYNLLWHEEQVWVIDVSQAVDITHPRALEFLLRDCTNVSSFFQKNGVLEVPAPEDLFFQICGKYPIFKSEDQLPEKEN